jgi:hypothetical protein
MNDPHEQTADPPPRTRLPDGLGPVSAERILQAMNLTEMAVQAVHIDWQSGTCEAVVYILDRHGRHVQGADGAALTTTIGYAT